MAKCATCGGKVRLDGQDCLRCEIDLMINCAESREDILKMRRIFDNYELELTRVSFEREHPFLYVTKAGL